VLKNLGVLKSCVKILVLKNRRKILEKIVENYRKKSWKNHRYNLR